MVPLRATAYSLLSLALGGAPPTCPPLSLPSPSFPWLGEGIFFFTFASIACVFGYPPPSPVFLLPLSVGPHLPGGPHPFLAPWRGLVFLALTLSLTCARTHSLRPAGGLTTRTATHLPVHSPWRTLVAHWEPPYPATLCVHLSFARQRPRWPGGSAIARLYGPK